MRVVFNNARIRGQPKPRGNHTSPHSDTVPAKSPKILEECAEETHNADVNGSWVIYHPNVIPCFVSESFGMFHFLPSPKTLNSQAPKTRTRVTFNSKTIAFS